MPPGNAVKARSLSVRGAVSPGDRAAVRARLATGRDDRGVAQGRGLPDAGPARRAGPGPQLRRRVPRLPERLHPPAFLADTPGAGQQPAPPLPVPRLGVQAGWLHRPHPRGPMLPALRPRELAAEEVPPRALWRPAVRLAGRGRAGPSRASRTVLRPSCRAFHLTALAARPPLGLRFRLQLEVPHREHPRVLPHPLPPPALLRRG